MKNYSIGRDEGCSILISDPSKMVSRNHATLSVNGTRMTITDHSSNGTYINSIRISTNTPVPVTRKDVVSFANVANLDWTKVPNPVVKITLASVIVAVIVALLCVLSYYWNHSKEQEQQIHDNARMEQMRADSLKNADLQKRIAQLKLHSDTLVSECRNLDDRFAKINKVIDSKEQNKAMKNLIKSLGSIEETLKTVDAEAFRNSVDKVEGNLRDNVKETPERVEKLEKQFAEYKGVIKETEGKLAEIERQLRTIPNKEVKKPEEKKPEEEKKDTAVMGPKRIF